MVEKLIRQIKQFKDIQKVVINIHPDKPEVRLITTDINNIGFCLNLGVKQAKVNITSSLTLTID